MILDDEKAAMYDDQYILRVYADMLLNYAFIEGNAAFCLQIINRMKLYTNKRGE